ncbi:uncharacterized protein LOC107037859 isoform X2 [Diachasma alloeum]|uniref:uncharacterized protein LOC107037859 isoform X2 n=1 Tax=Diachasma alloeum TaxID=454923 RepID=UPI0007384AF5|nr:uncharacterized protein LOC107037859 isoform X2 [Diachasma alloeum]
MNFRGEIHIEPFVKTESGVEDRALIRGTEPDGGKLKDFSLCLYTGYGYFKNGAFDLEYIKKFLEDSTPDKVLAKRVYEESEEHLKGANALQGADEEKTYSFWLRNFDQESRNLREQLWC